MRRKGQVWISATIYILVAVTALVIILAATQPLINRMRDKATVQKQKETMVALDEQITGVAEEGAGSQRVVPIDILEGQIVVKNEGLVYEVETESKVVESGSQIELGNLIISSGNDVNAYEDNNSYVLENSKVRVILIKTNNLGNTSDIIQEITLKSTNATVDGFEFEVDSTDTTELETGSYTELDNEGNALGSASVTAHCNQTKNIYDLVFTLDSEADFLRVDVENLVKQ